VGRKTQPGHKIVFCGKGRKVRPDFGKDELGGGCPDAMSVLRMFDGISIRKIDGHGEG
jgi:hypothetical protein